MRFPWDKIRGPDEEYWAGVRARRAYLSPGTFGFFTRVEGHDLYEHTDMLAGLRAIEAEITKLKEVPN